MSQKRPFLRHFVVIRNVMNRLGFILFFLIIFSVQIVAQWRDFPSAPESIPETKLNGAIHTVLTIERTDDCTHRTQIEIYDNEGRRTEKISHSIYVTDEGKSLRSDSKVSFIYDSSGKLIKEFFWIDGRKIRQTNYIYDSTKRLTEKVDYSANGHKVSKTTYNYFPQKQQVEVDWITLKSDESVNSSTRVSLFYNEKKQWTKRTALDSLNEDGSTYSGDFITFDYDEKGNVINNAHCCKYKFSSRYDYQFDERENWIERRETYIQLNKATGKETVKPGMQTYRILTYYRTDNGSQ